MALWPLLNHRKIQSLELLQKAEKMSTHRHANNSAVPKSINTRLLQTTAICPLATIFKVNTCKYSCTQEHKWHGCKLKQPLTSNYYRFLANR